MLENFLKSCALVISTKIPILLTIHKIDTNKVPLRTIDLKMTSQMDNISTEKHLFNRIITNISRTTFRKERKHPLEIMLGARYNKIFSNILILSNQDFLLLRAQTKEMIEMIELILNTNWIKNRNRSSKKLRNLIIWHSSLHLHLHNLNRYFWLIKISFKIPKRRIMSNINFTMNHYSKKRQGLNIRITNSSKDATWLNLTSICSTHNMKINWIWTKISSLNNQVTETNNSKMTMNVYFPVQYSITNVSLDLQMIQVENYIVTLSKIHKSIIKMIPIQANVNPLFL